MRLYYILLLILLALLTTTLTHIFSPIPKRSLPLLTNVPDYNEIALEVRYPLSAIQGQNLEIRIINLANGDESAWALPERVLSSFIGRDEMPYQQRASWASGKKQLLLARGQEVDLLNMDGSFTALPLHAPEQKGALDRFNGMHNFALSENGEFVAYSLYTRDKNDKLYTDLVFQSTKGAEPKQLATGGYIFLPDWSPEGRRLAYRTEDNNVIVIDLAGQKLVSILPPFKIIQGPNWGVTQIRWSPNGTKLAFVYNDRLFLTDLDQNKTKEVMSGQGNINVRNFSWSPDGSHFVFRSSFEGSHKCSNIGVVLETGNIPCTQGDFLYTSNIDGSEIKRITNTQEYGNDGYRNSELFWIDKTKSPILNE